MSDAPNRLPNSPWPRLVLRRADQAVCAAVAAASIIAIGVWGIQQGFLRGRAIDIERAEPIAIEFRIDVNRADWPELALLPNVGEQLARRIVAERTTRGPFRDLADLERVRGIGPKTLDGMKPYLLPLADTDAVAGGMAEAQRAARLP